MHKLISVGVLHSLPIQPTSDTKVVWVCVHVEWVQQKQNMNYQN